MKVYQSKYIFTVLAMIMAAAIGFFIPSIEKNTLIMLFMVAIFVLIFSDPFIGLLISLPLVMWLSYVDLFVISGWNYVVVILSYGIILGLLRRQALTISIRSRDILKVCIVFMIFITFINLRQTGMTLTLTYTAKLISMLLLGVSTSLLIRTDRQLKIFIYVMAGCMAVSAIVGIAQFMGIDFFWKLRESLGIDPESMVGIQIINRVRVPGLAYFSIPFGYQLCSIIPLIFGILYVKSERSFSKFTLIIAFGICFLALFMSMAKSALAGAILGVLLTRHLLVAPQRKMKNIVFSIIILAMIALSYHVFLNNTGFAGFMLNTKSSMSRIPLWITAVKIFRQNPFGIGAGQFSAYGLDFFPELAHMRGAYNILSTSSHNQFLNTLVYYGVIGLTFLSMFYYLVFKGLICLKEREYGPFLRGVNAGMIGMFFSYVVNSMFHNAGPFLIDPFNWYFIGLAMFLFNNYARKESNG